MNQQMPIQTAIVVARANTQGKREWMYFPVAITEGFFEEVGQLLLRTEALSEEPGMKE